MEDLLRYFSDYWFTLIVLGCVTSGVLLLIGYAVACRIHTKLQVGILRSLEYNNHFLQK